MAHLIDKDALVAEIDGRIKNLYPKGGQGLVVTKILKDHYEDLLIFLDTLEVKEIEEEPVSKVFDDAIEHGKNIVLAELERIVKDKEEAGKNYVFVFSEVKDLVKKMSKKGPTNFASKREQCQACLSIAEREQNQDRDSWLDDSRA